MEITFDYNINCVYYIYTGISSWINILGDNMVWCPIHNYYINGRQAKQKHYKTGCNFISLYEKPKIPDNYKYRKSRSNSKDSIHKEKYIRKRERSKRSIYRTNIIKKAKK